MLSFIRKVLLMSTCSIYFIAEIRKNIHQAYLELCFFCQHDLDGSIYVSMRTIYQDYYGECWISSGWQMFVISLVNRTSPNQHFNLYHSLGKFSRQRWWYFSDFSQEIDFDISHSKGTRKNTSWSQTYPYIWIRRQFAWNVNITFWEKI